jgi:hypothetical protein
MNPKIVGRFPRVIAEMAGFRVPENTTVLICPYEKVGKDAPLSIEKLCPLLTFYQVDGFQQAIERCREILQFGGLGHSSSIHAKDQRAIEEFGLRMPACRINVNSPSTQGSIGYTTNLDPSMTLGCGTPGGNIFSDNIGPLHLINIKRVAFVNDAMLKEDERLEHELRREFGESALPWGAGNPHPGPSYTPSASVHRPHYTPARPAQAGAPARAGQFGASPLTPADIEAIISRHAR